MITWIGRVDDASQVYRADGDTLRVIEVADTLGALLRIDQKYAVFLADGDVGALGFSGRAAGALGGDDFVGHGFLLYGAE